MARTVQPSWIAAAALTVLSSATVAALALTLAPAPTAVPAGRVAAAYETAPAPVSIAFPAPATEAPEPEPPAGPAPPPAPAAVAAAAPAPAAEPAPPADPLCAGEGWQQRRGEQAAARLRRPADARAVPVAFRPARPDVLGMADLQEQRVDVFVRSCARQSDALLLHVLAHELGHVLDARVMTDELRDQWKAARGIPASTPWFGCDGCTDFATPAGDFAETYAQWQRGATSSRSQVAAAPSREELQRLAERFFPAL